MSFAMGTPLLDGCVLAVLAEEDTYGYALTQRVKGVLDISESTLYPILCRLQKKGHLTVDDRPYQGRNRRYYAITYTGQERLEQARREWESFRDGVETLLMKGKTEHEWSGISGIAEPGFVAMLGESVSGAVTVTVPADARIRTAKIETSMGDIALSGLSGGVIDAESDMGDVSARDMGDVDELDPSSSTGDVFRSGKPARKTDLETDMGAVTVTAACAPRSAAMIWSAASAKSR